MERSGLVVLRKACAIYGVFGKLPLNLFYGSAVATTGFSRRCQSGSATVEVQDSTEVDVNQPLSENDYVNPQFENRNPRNLEKMSLARKPQGWKLDYPTRQYWHKIFLNQTGRHTTAHVEHFTGSTVISASTKEWSIKKHLYGTRDVSAAQNIGRIITQRCLESGINWVHVHFSQEEKETERVKAFLSALESGGLRLTEPFRLYPLRDWL